MIFWIFVKIFILDRSFHFIWICLIAKMANVSTKMLAIAIRILLSYFIWVLGFGRFFRIIVIFWILVQQILGLRWFLFNLHWSWLVSYVNRLWLLNFFQFNESLCCQLFMPITTVSSNLNKDLLFNIIRAHTFGLVGLSTNKWGALSRQPRKQKGYFVLS